MAYAPLEQISPGIFGIPPLQPSYMDNWISNSIVQGEWNAQGQPGFGGLGQSGTINIDPGSALNTENTIDIGKGLDNANDWLAKIFNSILPTPLFPTAADTRAAGGNLASFLDPVRWVTVIVGLLFIFGGLYILGTSQISSALSGVISEKERLTEIGRKATEVKGYFKKSTAVKSS